MDRIYMIPLDIDLDEKLKAFQEQLNEGEQIVSTSPVNDKLLIITRETKQKASNRNLLLEEMRGKERINGK